MRLVKVAVHHVPVVNTKTSKPCLISHVLLWRSRINLLNRSGASFCINCVNGTFTAGGEAICSSCPRGRYRGFEDEHDPDTAQCLLCARGTFSPDGSSSTCLPCATGSMAAYTGAFLCDLAPKGFFINVSSATLALPCQPGYATADAGSTTCISCAVGRYAAKTEAKECDDAAAGYYVSDQGATSAQVCLPGTMSSVRATQCTPCEIGKFSSVDASVACSACADNTIAPIQGSSLCYDCRTYGAKAFGSTSCECPLGSYGDALVVNQSYSMRCYECSQGAKCDHPGLSFAGVQSAPGWWRSDNESTSFVKCLRASHCIGNQCAPNREGPLW
jgi:hypothetical protein